MAGSFGPSYVATKRPCVGNTMFMVDNTTISIIALNTDLNELERPT